MPPAASSEGVFGRGRGFAKHERSDGRCRIERRGKEMCRGEEKGVELTGSDQACGGGEDGGRARSRATASSDGVKEKMSSASGQSGRQAGEDCGVWSVSRGSPVTTSADRARRKRSWPGRVPGGRGESRASWGECHGLVKASLLSAISPSSAAALLYIWQTTGTLGAAARRGLGDPLERRRRRRESRSCRVRRGVQPAAPLSAPRCRSRGVEADETGLAVAVAVAVAAGGQRRRLASAAFASPPRGRALDELAVS
ncbi:unnamed protein product [Diplocarpon coronariae]